MVLKKITFLFLLVSASLISITFAGREFMDKPVAEVSAASEELSEKSLHHSNEAAAVHERLLRVNSKDYGTYDPAPALVKPPFKLIPN